MGRFENSGIYLGAFCDKKEYSNSASRRKTVSNSLTKFVRMNFFTLPCWSGTCSNLIPSNFTKIYITNLALTSIHFVNLISAQFAQFNKTTKWQDILRLDVLAISQKRSFILKSGLGKVPFLFKCVLTPLIICQRSSILSLYFFETRNIASRFHESCCKKTSNEIYSAT